MVLLCLQNYRWGVKSSVIYVTLNSQNTKTRIALMGVGIPGSVFRQMFMKYATIEFRRLAGIERFYRKRNDCFPLATLRVVLSS